MQLNRRHFLAHLAAGSLLAAGACRPAAAPRRKTPAVEPDRSLDLLILGGTGFLGPHVVRSALSRGHRMTLFNRGRTNPHLFPDLEKLVGDRDGQLDALRGRAWDAVIDTSGYVPRLVGDSARLLAGNVGHYQFVSTISVYADFSVPGMDEAAPLATIDDPDIETIDGATYGPLKALSEQAAQREMPGRVMVVRPGLIVGPGDKTDRYTYWPVRAARGGDILAPGDGKTFVQFVDVRDLADWMVSGAERSLTGTFNAIASPATYTMAGLLTDCIAAAQAPARPVWVDAAFLEARGVAPWSDLPVWMPPTGSYAAFGRIANERALSAGLRFRSPARTAAATLAWWQALPDERRSKLRAGLAPDRESELLAEFRAASASPVDG